jgi:hypothetical protein
VRSPRLPASPKGLRRPIFTGPESCCERRCRNEL